MSFGVYVHIPYCVKKCPYCDFNSYGRGKLIPEQEYTDALVKELSFYGDLLADRTVDTVFFGGGTPSLFSARSIDRVLDTVRGLSKLSESAEVTVEANPKTADLERLRGFRLAGVNRMSVGVQSFSEQKLKFLGRINGPDDSRRILDDFLRAGFDNFNLDLMYGIPGETAEQWENDLLTALGFGTTHISAYALTIEEGTEFERLYDEGALDLPSEDEIVRLIEITNDLLPQKGYRRYEISNFALPGYECRHNLLYWRGEDYLGIGAGAHSHTANGDFPVSKWGERWANILSPEQYIKTVGEDKKPLLFKEVLSQEQALSDSIMMGLRLKEGIQYEKTYKRFGVRAEFDTLGPLIDDGYILKRDDRLTLSEKGLMVSDELIARVVDAFSHCGA